MRFSTIAAAAAVAGSASAVSICDKYTTALLKNNTAANQYALVTLLVKTAAVGSFTGAGSPNPTLPGSTPKAVGFLTPGNVGGQAVNLMPYFNGELLSSNVNGMPASINWLDTNTTLLATDPLSLGEMGTNSYTLISHLVSYFGVLLGCSEYGNAGFPVYAGDNSQYNVHKYMDLSEAEFTYFIEGVANSAKSFGAATTDIMAAGTALNMTFGYRCAPAAMVAPNTPAELQAICIDSSCPVASGASCADAAETGYTATEPATATMTGTTVIATSEAATGTGSMAMTSAATGTPAPYNPNAASKQGAAAGLMAAAGIAAAALL